MALDRQYKKYAPEMPRLAATPPLAHRSAITAVDSSDPADDSGAVDCSAFEQCQFDITISGVSFGSLEVQVIFWNSRQSKWFGGGRRSFDAVGQHALVVDARGKKIFLKVTKFVGTSFSLSADYSLS